MFSVSGDKDVAFDMPAPRVLHAYFEGERATAPARTTRLVAEVERQSTYGPVVVLAHFAPNVRMVDVSAVQHWVQVAAKPNVRLAGAGVVTTSAMIRLAAQTLGLATRVRGMALQVAGFDDLAEALTWGRRLAV